MPETASSIYTITAPALIGVWVFDPISPSTTERNYIHAEGRTENISAKATEIELVGRLNPLVEYGEATLVGLALTILVPFGDTHDVAVQWWRQALSNRRAICYRDNRKRLMWGALNKELPIVDGRAGTAISVSLRRIDFDEAV